MIRQFMKKGVEGRVWEWAAPKGTHTLLLWSNQSNGQQIAEQLSRMFLWLGVPRPITVVLWYIDVPRILKKEEWPTAAHVNGGWTVPNTSTIFIYREEEWDRVVFHELIHALGWDWQMPQTPLACWRFPAQSEVYPHLFEAWTELLAEWMWVSWHAEDFKTWEEQRKWQDHQASQVLARWQGTPWKEDTNIFAYYVLKAALAPYIAPLLLQGPPKDLTAFLCSLDWRSVMQESPETLSMRMTHPDIA
jgi:hypothetical protein